MAVFIIIIIVIFLKPGQGYLAVRAYSTGHNNDNNNKKKNIHSGSFFFSAFPQEIPQTHRQLHIIHPWQPRARQVMKISMKITFSAKGFKSKY